MYTKENFKNDVDSTFSNSDLNTNGVVSSSTFEKIKTVIKKSVDVTDGTGGSANNATLTVKQHDSKEPFDKLFEPATIIDGVIDLDFNTEYMPWMNITYRGQINLAETATYANAFSRPISNGKIMKYDLVIPESFLGKSDLAGKSPQEKIINVGYGWSSSIVRLPFANSSVALIDQFRSTFPASEPAALLKITFTLDKSAGITFDDTGTIASGYKLVVQYVDCTKYK